MDSIPTGVDFRKTGRGFAASASPASVAGAGYAILLAMWIGVVASHPPMWPRWNAFLPLLVAMTGTVAVPAAMGLFGRVIVRRDGDELSVFRGIGGIGWTRRFSWRDLASVREAKSLLRSGLGARAPVVEFAFRPGTRWSWRFGSNLPSERRRWLISVLEQALRDGRA